MWSRGFVAAIAAVLMLGGVLPAHADGQEPAGELYQAASVDIDADGRTEVATVHAMEQDPTAREYTAELVVRRGSDGAPLWSTTVPNGALTLTPAAVGPNGERGFYLIVRRFNYFVSLQTTEDGVSLETPVPLLYGRPTSGFDIFAFTAGGTLLWERHLTAGGSATDPTRATGQPFDVRVLNATPSSADDVLLVLLDGPVVVTAHNDGATAIRATVVDGADGTDAASVVAADQVSHQGAPLTVADFDGDGLEDFALQLPDGRIGAHRGTDGHLLWQTDGNFYGLDAGADVTADGISDVFATATSRFAQNPGDVRLIDGRTGRTLLEDVAHEAWPTPAGIATATRIQEGEQVALELQSFDLAGVVRHARTISAPQAGPSSFSVRRDMGDLNSSGSSDVSLTITQNDNGTTTQHAAVLDGLTLAALWSHAPGLPLHASIDGDGDDLLRWQPWGKYAVDVSAQDGATGDPLWTTRIVPPWERTTMVLANAGDVNGDGHADVLVELDGERVTRDGDVPDDLARRVDYVTELHVLDGRDGGLVWKR